MWGSYIRISPSLLISQSHFLWTGLRIELIFVLAPDQSPFTFKEFITRSWETWLKIKTSLVIVISGIHTRSLVTTPAFIKWFVTSGTYKDSDTDQCNKKASSKHLLRLPTKQHVAGRSYHFPNKVLKHITDEERQDSISMAAKTLLKHFFLKIYCL